MPWWGWVIVGTFLLGAELLGVDAAFYLLFIGFAAVVTGLLKLLGPEMAPWIEWLIFAGLGLAFMVLFRKRIYTQFRGVTTDYHSGPEGNFLKLESDLGPSETCRMQYRGTTWTVLNQDNEKMAAGARVRIVRVDGTQLIVEKAAD